MLTTESIRRGYQYFYQKVYNNSNYQFNYSPTSQKQVESFLRGLEKKNLPLSSLGYNFLWKYLLFQFNYWDSLTIKAFNGQMNFSYIFGSKALLRYFERNQEFDWTLEFPKLIQKHVLEELRFKQILDSHNNEPIIYRNPIRLIGLNTDAGFNNCIQSTTLYDFKDLSCIMCNYKVECKELLRVNFPKIYKERYGRKSTNS